MTTQLSYTSKFGYYGLRVNPTLEQVIGSVRKPIRLLQPDRAAKWYATSIYRDHLLAAGEAANAYDQAALGYRAAGADLPFDAAQVRPSDAGGDDVFRKIHSHGDALELQRTYEAAYKAMLQENEKETAALRYMQLRYSHGPNVMNPVIAAAHEELQQAGVAHSGPEPRFTPPATGWKTPHASMASAGQPQAPEFPTFESLNTGQPSDMRVANPTPSENRTYEEIRAFVVQPTWSS